MQIAVSPGDFSGSASIGSAVSAVAAPKWAGFTASGVVRTVTVTGSLRKPLTVSFAAGSAHPNAVPVIWRDDLKVGWYPIAVGPAGGVATAQRSQFSLHLPGWSDIAGWIGGAAAAAKRWALGRTTPPKCSSAPSWASVVEPTLDILLTCVQTTTFGGVTRIELKIKNNRGLVQQLTLPEVIADSDVDDQPPTVRQAIRALSGQSDIVLLPPGKEARIGFTQPTADQSIVLAPQVTMLALATELVLQLADLDQELGSTALLPGLLGLPGCFGLKSEVVAGVLPASLSAVRDLVGSAFSCLISATEDPKVAVSISQQFVATQQGRSLAIVKSDAEFNPEVEKIAGKLNLVGKLAKTVQVAKLAVSIWESVGEMLGRAIADPDPAAVRLMLAAPTKPRPAPGVLVIGPTGISGVNLGMTRQQARSADPSDFRSQPSPSGCLEGGTTQFSVTFSRTADGTDGPLEFETVLPGISYATPEGLTVGDTLDRAKALYGPALPGIGYLVRFPTGTAGDFYEIQTDNHPNDSSGDPIGLPYTDDQYRAQRISRISLTVAKRVCSG